MSDILIVEDDKELSTLLCDFLRAEDFTVTVAKNGEKAISYFEKFGARLVVLDINLPDIDGFTICRKLRERTDTPIIIVSARTEKDDKLNGLTLGADDYIEKPYDIDIMLAKIKGIFKRRYQEDIISGDGVVLNIATRCVTIDGKEVDLPSKEFDLLAILVENKDRALNKEFLFNSVWGIDSDSELQTLHVHINRLRAKLGDDPKHAKRLLTVWGVGYKFV